MKLRLVFSWKLSKEEICFSNYSFGKVFVLFKLTALETGCMYLVSVSRWFSFGTFLSDLKKAPFKLLFLDELWSLIHFYLSIVLFVASEIMVHSSSLRNLYLGYIWLRVFKLPWLHHAVSCGTNCSPTKSHYAYPPTTKPENSVLLILAKHRATNFKAILISQSVSIHLKICA